MQPSGDVSLWTEFTQGGEATGIDEMVETWNAMGNGITVTHRPIGNEEFFTVIRTALAGGEPPDLLQYEGYQQTRDFAAAGQLTDLTELWEANQEQLHPLRSRCAGLHLRGQDLLHPLHLSHGLADLLQPGNSRGQRHRGSHKLGQNSPPPWTR